MEIMNPVEMETWFHKKCDGETTISPEMLTRREKIKRILQDGRFTDLDELIMELEFYDKKVLINDLQHIERSLKRLHQKLKMIFNFPLLIPFEIKLLIVPEPYSFAIQTILQVMSIQKQRWKH